MFNFSLHQKKRHILHVDADAFFASVEQVMNPSLRGKAIAIGGNDKNSGIISACSYEARKFGLYSGMPVYLAKKKCPNLTLVSSHFDVYREFSKKLYEIFTKYTLQVEMVSIDEGFLDITGYNEFFNKTPKQMAESILTEVYKKIGITVSCGLASNKTVAKVASSINKPHKLTHVPFGKESSFLAPLSLKTLPGVGKKTFSLLKAYGFDSIGDFASLTSEDAFGMFGSSGVALWKKANGVDNRDVISTTSLPKSISKEKTVYHNTITSKAHALKLVKQLSRQVFTKLRENKMKAKTITLHIRYKKNNSFEKPPFEDYTFRKNIGFFSSNDSVLYPKLAKMLETNLDFDLPIRLLGVGVSDMRQNYNLDLFSNEHKEDSLFSTIDKIQASFGTSSLLYGA